jgi:hypothetical protein
VKPLACILFLTALLPFAASSATQKMDAKPCPVCASFTVAWRGLPMPAAHLRSAGADLIFEFGFRPAGDQVARTRRLLTLRLILTPSSKFGVWIHSGSLGLAFPRRSA